MHYRNLICSILFLFFTACSGGDHPNTESTKELQKQDSSIDTVNDLSQADTLLNNIEGIQKAYEMIAEQMNKGAFDSTSFKYNCNNEKSGEVGYFSQNGQLRMIVHRFNEYDHHSAEDYYYVKDSILFFVYNIRVSWVFDSGPEGSTKDNITEQRVYLIDQKPTRCLEKKFAIRSHASNNPKSETIPNREVDCATIKSVVEPFQVLIKHRYKATSGCL